MIVVNGVFTIPLSRQPAVSASAASRPAARSGGLTQFIAGPENRLLGVTLKPLLESADRRFEPLSIYGPPGCGKTHLARGLAVWFEPPVSLRGPQLYNLRSDPFERATEDASMFYDKWKADRAFLFVPAQAIVGQFLETFKEFPPRQRPASFSIDQALEKARQQQTAMSTGAGVGVK